MHEYRQFNSWLPLSKEKQGYSIWSLVLTATKGDMRDVIGPGFCKRLIYQTQYPVYVWEPIFTKDLVLNLENDGFMTRPYDRSGVALLKKRWWYVLDGLYPSMQKAKARKVTRTVSFHKNAAPTSRLWIWPLLLMLLECQSGEQTDSDFEVGSLRFEKVEV